MTERVAPNAVLTLQLRQAAIEQAISILHSPSDNRVPKANDLVEYAARIEAYLKEGR